jgi:tetratricopeptide (TPR) repeat protein
VKRLVLLLVFAFLTVGTLVRLTQIRDAKPAEARLGFFPPAPVIKALSADQYQFVSQVISLQCLFYFGTLVEQQVQRPDLQRIHQALYTSTRLDPYNMDAYYFAQAVLTWETNMIPQVIDLLEYGFAHRSWDWYLPFFLSFDYAYFLRDYKKAGEYLAQVAKLKPEVNWYATLAARYFYEGGSTALALAYLKEIIPTARNEAIKRRMMTRAEALEKILKIEQAIVAYRKRFQRDPKELGDLVNGGVLDLVPEDPYGGSFYLDKTGRVRTTSKLAHGAASSGTHKN